MSINAVADALEEGLVIVDQKEMIVVFNKRAKEITGIIHDDSLEHPGGRINKGDYVLVADINLGEDDGNLSHRDLEILGIKDKRIAKGSTLLAIGKYGLGQGKYKLFSNNLAFNEISLEDNQDGYRIKASINNSTRSILLEHGELKSEVSYMQSYGHMLVVSPQGKLRFAQSKGYSYRGEGIGDLLRGGEFQEKKALGESRGVLGLFAGELFGPGPFLNAIREVLTSGKKIDSKIFEVQRRQLVASMKLVNQDDSRLAVINLRDASKLKDLLEERNRILLKLEEGFNKRNDGTGQLDNLPALVGGAAKMQELKYLITRASSISSNVLITGKNGTGKSLVAREIHRLSKQKGPFVEVNCGSLPHGLFESELFGYKGGAFTGALAQGKEGFFDRAQGGTIFLDEISEIPPYIQSKLLHAIQEKKYYPLGSNEFKRLDARVIAASNRDLKLEMNQGNFREDLFFRLNVFPIEVPRLSERREDLYFLVRHIVDKISANLGISPKEISSSAMEKIQAYSWPGNVRELENVIERGLIISGASIIYPEHLNIPEVKNTDFTLKKRIEEAEKAILEEMLGLTQDKNKIIEILGISKASLYEKLKKYGLKAKRS